jgi:hypothetical protein
MASGLPGEIVTALTCWNADMQIIYLNRIVISLLVITIGMPIFPGTRISISIM